jgi:hypothetical protein
MIKYIVEARSASMGETALDANSTAKNQHDADRQADIWAQNMNLCVWRGVRDWQPHVRVVEEAQPWE